MVAELLQIFATAGDIVTLSEAVLEPKRGQMSDDALSALMEFLQHSPFRTLAPVQHLDFCFDEASRRQREIFSSLPTINIPSLYIGSYTGETIDGQEWAWFAYGLYHPSARFPKLDVIDLDLSEQNASPMKSIPTAHASLHRLYYGQEDDSVSPEDFAHCVDAHYTVVTVCAGTTCYENASLQGRRLCELNHETMLTAVVKYATRDLDQLPTVVCVVVPTHGYGWIPQTSITRVSWLRPSLPSIQELAVGMLKENPSMPVSSIGPLVRNVASLDLTFWGETSASRLLEVLRARPGVKRLHVHHRGDLWHDWDENTAGDDPALMNLKLQSLTMFWYDTTRSILAPSKTAWNTCLRQSSSFHIRTPSSLNLNQEAAQDAFRQGCTVEQFVRRSCSSYYSGNRIPYEEGRTNTRKLLKITKGTNDKAQLPLCVEARLAFASVIKRTDREKDDRGEIRRLRPRRTKPRFEGLGKLSQDIAQLI